MLREDLEDLVGPGGSCRLYLWTTWSHCWVSSQEWCGLRFRTGALAAMVENGPARRLEIT